MKQEYEVVEHVDIRRGEGGRYALRLGDAWLTDPLQEGETIHKTDEMPLVRWTVGKPFSFIVLGFNRRGESVHREKDSSGMEPILRERPSWTREVSLHDVTSWQRRKALGKFGPGRHSYTFTEPGVYMLSGFVVQVEADK